MTCRPRHADVLEYLWYLNAHADPVYQLAYGDKDTFLFAFILAAKLDHYFQVTPNFGPSHPDHCIGPSVLTTWAELGFIEHWAKAGCSHIAHLSPVFDTWQTNDRDTGILTLRCSTCLSSRVQYCNEGQVSWSCSAALAEVKVGSCSLLPAMCFAGHRVDECLRQSRSF